MNDIILRQISKAIENIFDKGLCSLLCEMMPFSQLRL